MTDALRLMAKQRLYEQVLDRLRQYVTEGACGPVTGCRPNGTWHSGWASAGPR